MRKPPFSTLSQVVEIFVSQTLQNCQVIVWSAGIISAWTIPFALMTQTSVTFTLHFTWCPFGVAEWHWILPPTWLMLHFWIVAIAPVMTFRKKVWINFQPFFQFTTNIHSWLILIFHEQVRKVCCKCLTFIIFHSKLIGRSFKTYQYYQQVCKLFGDGHLRLVHKFSWCFYSFRRLTVTMNKVDLQTTNNWPFLKRINHPKLVFCS